jgi:nuclear pore complex protein Nup85
MATSLRTSDPLGEGAIFVQRLLFAQRYAEFHKACIEGNLLAAAEHLVEIFADELAPKSWWAVLLTDAAELLTSGELKSRRGKFRLANDLAGELIFRADEVFEFLGRLEEIQSRIHNGFDDDYLHVLLRILKASSAREGLKRLEIVRLSLARYFARCSSIGVGGKGRIDNWTQPLPF